MWRNFLEATSSAHPCSVFCLCDCTQVTQQAILFAFVNPQVLLLSCGINSCVAEDGGAEARAQNQCLAPSDYSNPSIPQIAFCFRDVYLPLGISGRRRIHSLHLRKWTHSRSVTQILLIFATPDTASLVRTLRITLLHKDWTLFSTSQ